MVKVKYSIQYICIVIVMSLAGCLSDNVPTDAVTALQAPRLSNPPDMSVDINIRPILGWQVSRLATSYHLQVSSDSLFSSIVYDTSSITQTYKNVSGLSYATQYFWRVQAQKNNITSGWSNIWQFTTGSLPQTPLLSLPENDVTDISVPPRLCWKGGGLDQSYTIHISRNRSFTDVVFEAKYITDTSIEVSELNNSTKYFWRVNSTNKHGTSEWSSKRNFTTGITCPGLPTVSYEGKTYNTVKIGNQCWLKENIDVGLRIDGNINPTDNSIIEKYCYDNDTANCRIYGALYWWSEAMKYSTTEGAQGICPNGFQVPTNEEFHILSNAVGGDGNALKEIGQGFDWGRGTNTSGFSALLAGSQENRSYHGLGYNAPFWSSTKSGTTYAYQVWLEKESAEIRFASSFIKYGHGIRCIKD